MAESTSVTSPFRLSEVHPSGTFLSVEASAGTGKTYTLAALAVQALAEGRATASQLLVVTFTRAAAAELRHRVRRRLEECAAALGDPGGASEHPDELVRLLVRGSVGEVSDRRRRLEAALTEFDTAVVTTIHGFALQALAASGVSAGVDLDARLVDDTDRRVPEVAADTIVAGALRGDFGAVDPSGWPTISTLGGYVSTALPLHGLRIRPVAGDTIGKGTSDGFYPKDLLMADMVRSSVAEVHRRRRLASTIGYDDLLTGLAAVLDSTAAGAVVHHLCSRFRVVMVDEFQDTDAVQWRVLSGIFGLGVPRPPELLAVVGDPKQAIYSFRGADVAAYLGATGAAAASQRRRLDTNWRSDERALGAVATLFEGVSFGDERISFSGVDACDPMAAQRLRIAGRDASGIDVRVVRPEPDRITRRGYPAPEARAAVMADLAGSIRELLDHGELPDGDGSRRVGRRDIAVLVRTGEEAKQVLGSLRRAHVPAVLARSTSVLESRAADQWRWLLDALVRPGDLRRVRLAALSWFGGWTAAEVAAAGDHGLDDLQSTLVGLDDVLTRRGAATFVREVMARTGVTGEALGRADGDRALTDLQHVGELLSSVGGPVTAAALLASLDGADDDKDEDDDHQPDRQARRVESDEDAVQVMTVWVSKGLEFPVVACPTLWAHGLASKVHRDPESGERTMAIASGGAKGATARKALVEAEMVGERLRLLYVALTRARHRTMLWWAPSDGARCASTALARVLFARTEEGLVDPALFEPAALARKADVPGPEETDEALRLLGRLEDLSDGAISVSEATAPGGVAAPPVPPAVDAADLVVASLDRPLDRRTMRWSFSAIKSRDHGDDDPLDTTGADGGADDEQLPPDPEDTPEVAQAQALPGAISPMAGLPGGTTFGNLLHSVLEHADFAAADLRGELTQVVDDEQRRRRVPLSPDDAEEPSEADGRDRLVEGLVMMADTPLGATLDHRPLRTFSRGDRLDELAFDLHLAGAGDARVSHLGAALLAHLPPTDRFAGWAGRLAAGELDVDLRGHLTGSIDAVLRVGRPGQERFVVVDYKSNRLHTRGSPPAADDYGASSMVGQMEQSHYTLQALIYLVAVHRYLRWRLPDYDPQRHLGGSAYLFARGMAGPATRVVDGAVDGVCEWRPPPAAVVAASDALDGIHPASTSADPGGGA